MKSILFLSFCEYKSIKDRDIYPDILREFIKHGDYVCLVSPVEKKKNIDTYITNEQNCDILHVKIGNYFNVNPIEKGLSLLTIDSQVLSALKKAMPNKRFDLVLYATPPIMFAKTISYYKNKGAKTYLMLKDIFPQNAVDLGMMFTSGIKGLLYSYFRKAEKKLYSLSDYIGCMSQANVDYVIAHNKVNPQIVEVCPNCIDPQDMRLSPVDKIEMRNKYSIPQTKKVFVYGGNLGKPQGIPFLIECLEKEKNKKDAFFLIVGDGTEFSVLQDYFDRAKPENAKLMKRLPKEDYDRMIAACDVGLIFLDHRFTIPNFPSRLLSYIQAGIPVIAATDLNTDIGKVLVNEGIGWWCESNDSEAFSRLVEQALQSDLLNMQKREFEYLQNNATSRIAYNVISKHFDS